MTGNGYQGTPGQFVQYSADNVDHNSRTLDGTGTFHGMGIIASITPGTRATVVIPKRKVIEEEIAKAGRIEVLRDLHIKDFAANLDILWKLSRPNSTVPTTRVVCDDATCV